MLRNLSKSSTLRLFKQPLRCLSNNVASSGTKSGLLDGYGDNLFKGAVALPYLKKQGLSLSVLESGKWTTDGNADKVGKYTIT